MERFNMENDSHFVSLIIPTLGRGTLKKTKTALKNQTRPPDELIVVFDKQRNGPGWARNEGFKKAKGDLIAFTDDDCVPGEKWLEQMVEAIEKYDAAMVSSHYFETDLFLSEIRLRRKFPTTDQINPNGFIGNTGNIIYRRSCLEDCLEKDGFIFNPMFKAYCSEDIDLIFRLRNRGYLLVFIDNKIKHLKRVTPLKYMKQAFNRGMGIGILYRMHKNTLKEQAPDKSLLWNESKNRFSAFKWMIIFWKKGLGPFDWRSFSTIKYFLVFWIGEKIQAFGFLYSFLFKSRNA